ncbi:recombinase family protein [Nonomuraea sp. NPDC005983]|uniref:recombinase family protein n=1 Tax=Nonomuraea sp. NPDC005983 TaxID=3155595 RepID=UPI0033AFB18A
MAVIGLVRVGTDKQNTQRQHDALDPICLKVFEEKISGKLATDDRPALLDALSHIRDGDLLTVQKVDRLGRNLLEGLIVLTDLFQRGVGVNDLRHEPRHTRKLSRRPWPARLEGTRNHRWRDDHGSRCGTTPGKAASLGAGCRRCAGGRVVVRRVRLATR